MNGMLLMFIGFIFVIALAIAFFNLVLKRNEQDDAMVDRLIELNELTERNKMEKFMRDNDFYQVYQPFVDSATGKTVGFEVLSRLHGEAKGVTMPDTFLKKIKEENLFEKFDMFVFKKCCEWIKGFDEEFFVSCNFSRTTLVAKGAAARIAKAADDAGVRHSALAIEILEDELDDGGGGMRRNIAELKEMGFKIYLDDFGKPNTSVSDLMSYHPDVIKIDKSLLDNSLSEDGRRLFKSVINFAKESGARALCEGIETKEQAEEAIGFGCDMMQGFYYCKPMQAENPGAFDGLVNCEKQIKNASQKQK